MRIEDFGFTPEIGKDYSITFTQDGELLKHIVYNGSELEPLKFKDNSSVTLAITDYETGKLLFQTDFVSYNGKLYKKVFKLPLKNEDTNLNSNVYIDNLHYDLTTASVLVQVQGFTGEQYKLVVSGTTTNLETMEMPIVLEDNMRYSITTELVQGSEFKVTLYDQYDTTLDEKIFTAPLSTDWRFNEKGELNLNFDETGENDTLEPLPVEEDGLAGNDPATETDTEQHQETAEPNLTQDAEQEELAYTEELISESLQDEGGGLLSNPLVLGGIGLFMLLILILLLKKKSKKKKAKEEQQNSPQVIQDDEDEEDDDDDDEYLEFVTSPSKETAKDVDDGFYTPTKEDYPEEEDKK